MRLRLATADLERGLQELGWLQQQVTKGGREGPLAAAGTWALEGIVLHHLARVRRRCTLQYQNVRLSWCSSRRPL